MYFFHIGSSECWLDRVKIQFTLLSVTIIPLCTLNSTRLSGRSPFFEIDPLETESKILAGRYDAFKLYPNVSQSAALFIRKVLSAYPWWVCSKE